MPVQRKGFLFRHFEKVACGVVSLLLLVSIVYMIRRTGGEEVAELTRRIGQLTGRLNQQMDEPPPERGIPDYVTQWRRARSVAEPGDIRELFWYPWPVYYAGRRLAVNEEYVLQFREPLARNRVRLERLRQDGPPPNQVIGRYIHPVGMDYSRVRVYTGEVDFGSAMIVGEVGQREHKMPIVVDATVRERAEPPLEVSASAERGGIVVSWRSNEANEEGVVVEGYQVFRKRARNVTGQFELVGTVTVQTEESRRTESEAEGRAGRRWSPMEGREGSRAARRPRGAGPERGVEASEEEEGIYRWTDTNRERTVEEETLAGIKPEETYLYKVRTVAQESEPRTSEFSPIVRATALPTVDFKFTGQRGEQLRFEIIVYQNGGVYQESVMNTVGDEIGGFVDERSDVQNFLTGCFLIDFHPNAIRQQPFARSRIVYVDRQGHVRARWRNETAVEDLWEWEPETRPEEEPYGPGREPGMPPGRGGRSGIETLRPNR
jgi:hypothetical protein